jgi:hypothetical protein
MIFDSEKQRQSNRAVVLLRERVSHRMRKLLRRGLHEALEVDGFSVDIFAHKHK